MEDNTTVEARLPVSTRQIKGMYVSVILLLTALLVVSAGFIGQRLMLGLLSSQNAILKSMHEADARKIKELEQKLVPAEARVPQNPASFSDDRRR